MIMLLLRLLFRLFKILGVLFILALIILFVASLFTPIREPKKWGVTFSYPYSESLGIPWEESYDAMLQELHVRHIRLPVYWSLTEPEKDVFHFDELDKQMKKAEEANATVILAVGRKVPRWPECHEPEWIEKLPIYDQQKEILDYIHEVVLRYKDSKALVAWQVENEPFLPFGLCPKLDVGFLEHEIEYVKSLDPKHPIVVSDSGELSLWVRAAKRADIFGSTMYRTIYNKRFGYITYPLPARFFRAKRTLTELVVGKKPMMVIELQGEAWGPSAIQYFTKEERDKSMSPEKFTEIIDYAKRSGFDEFYLWGVEWWYWLKVHEHDPEIWNQAKDLFSTNAN